LPLRSEHLKHRNHELEFWDLVGRLLRGWEERKVWLNKNEHLLGWERLEPSV